MMLDILEEHLEEASWIYDVRAHLLRSYHVTLKNLEEWDERWLAHLDGLVIGAEYARPIVEKGLAEGDEGTVCAAAAVLACWGGGADRECLEAVLQDPASEQREPLLLGLGLAPSNSLDKWLDAWIRSGSPSLRVAAAETLRFRGSAPPLEVVRSLFRWEGQPAAVVRSTLRLVGDLRIAGCNGFVESALDSPDLETRAVAAHAAVVMGLRGARERWRTSIRQAGAGCPPDSLERLGLLGVSEDLPVIAGALETADLAAAAMRGLGWLGHPGAADPLLAKMADPKVARLAGHAFSTLFGVDLERDGLSAAPPAASAAGESNEEEIEIDRFEGLPRPDANRATAWWKQNAARFPKGTRWRAGRPFEAGAPAAILRNGPLADRPAAAQEIALTSKETVVLETRNRAAVQRLWITSHLQAAGSAAGVKPAIAATAPSPSR